AAVRAGERDDDAPCLLLSPLDERRHLAAGRRAPVDAPRVVALAELAEPVEEVAARASRREPARGGRGPAEAREERRGGPPLSRAHEDVRGGHGVDPGGEQAERVARGDPRGL